MQFLVRSANTEDVTALLRLAEQATLVSLYPDNQAVTKAVENSIMAFSSEYPPDDAVYLFVLEDLRLNEVIGVSMIFADYGTRARPYYYLRLGQKQYADQNMNIVMNQQTLRLEKDTQGLSLTGGVVLDAAYRNHPARLGKLIAHMRYIYMGMFPGRFQDRVIGEVAAPLTESGRNLFWESIGQKFTGISFQEFLNLNRTRNMEFVGNLFPKEEIFLCLLDESLRPSAERVRKKHGKIATRLVTAAGYKFTGMIHLHGGPVYLANVSDIPYIQQSRRMPINRKNDSEGSEFMMAGNMSDGTFRGGLISCSADYNEPSLCVDGQTMRTLGCRPFDALYVTPAFALTKQSEIYHENGLRG